MSFFARFLPVAAGRCYGTSAPYSKGALYKGAAEAERIDRLAYEGDLESLKTIFESAVTAGTLNTKRPPIIAALENPDRVNLDVVRYLISRGQVVTPWKHEGKVLCPLELAERKGDKDLIKVVLDNSVQS